MTGILDIIRKELLINLLSLRFIIGLVVVMLLIGLVGYVLTLDYASRRQAYIAAAEQHSRALEDAKVYSTIKVEMDIPPNPLSLLSRGSKDLPVTITVSPYHVPTILDASGSGATISLDGTGDLPVNPLLRVFSSIDVGFIVGMIMSLFCILLVFDSFSGEKEQGTLRVLLSAPVGRLQLLAGKYCGALLSAATPLTAGLLLLVILWNISGLVTLTPADWLGLACMYAASILYLACFLALGILISLFAEESVTGLVHQLLVWVVAGIVLPAGAGYVAEFLHPILPETELIREADENYGRAYSNVRYQQTEGSWNVAYTDYAGPESFLGITEKEALNRVEYNKIIFPMKFALAEEHFHIHDAVQRSLERREEARNSLDAISPVAAYGRIVRALAGSDIGSYRRTFAAARNYRESLMEYLRPKVATAAWVTRVLDQPELQPTKENMSYWNERAKKEGEDVFLKEWWNWSRVKPLDLSAMPRPNLEVPGLRERLGDALFPCALLMVLTAGFLVMAGWKLLRYPA